MNYPPFRFSMVEDGLFRGGYPLERNLDFLKVKTIISLTPEPLTEHNRFHLIWIKVDKPKYNIPLTFPKIVQILTLLLDSSLYPIYLHCLDGSFVTSIVIMCLRKIQGWALSSFVAEASRFVLQVGQEETVFVTKFTADIDTSKCPWFLPKKKQDPAPAERNLEPQISRTLLALDLNIN